MGNGVDGAGVTACIATFERPSELAPTIRTLLAGTVTPAVLLVSEGSANPAAREEAVRTVATASSRDVEARLLPQPPNGTRNGNRNWLLEHVETELALLLDDDIDVAPEFLADAIDRMRRDRELAVVTGTSRTHPAPVWLRHRGFFRPARPGEPIAVTPALALWRADAYRSLWQDEAIVYGFEEAELALRLHARGMKIMASAFPFVDRCAAETVRYAPTERDDLAERARCYVAAKRYATRRALLGFLLHELALNVARRRRPLPRSLVEGQWRDVALYVAGGGRPAWADLRARPRVAHLDEGRSVVRRPPSLQRAARLLNKPHYLFRPRQVFSRLGYAAQRRRLRLGETWTTSLPWGLKLRFVPGEMIGSSIARTGLYDLLVSEALSRLTDRGDLAVDAGANIGHMTSILALRAGPSGRVLAFEPHPLLSDALRQNVSLWPGGLVAPVEVLEVAVSDRSGQGWLRTDERFDENMGSAEVAVEPSEDDRSHSIALVRLDDKLGSAAVGILKLDVEGHELGALQGAAAALSDGRVRDVVFESHKGYPSPVTDLLQAAGFRVYALRQKLLGPELADPSERPAAWEPPSYLATLEPERAGVRFRTRGWTVLRRQHDNADECGETSVRTRG